VLYRFDRHPAEGIVQPATCFLANALEVISPEGNVGQIPYLELKAVCFVSEMAAADLFSVHQTFDRRPKTPGLWTRFLFRDGDRLDGILAHNLLDWPVSGFLITPPHAGAGRQKAFLPRAALQSTELLGVVGAPRRALEPRRTEGQLKMFDAL
jgi:hypothetical protein